MTTHSDGQPTTPGTATIGTGRALASAIAVFLGGYLLLASFGGGQLSTVAANVFAGLTGRPAPILPEFYAALLVLQFLFALIVVVAGLVLARGPLAGRLIGSALVVGGSLLTFVLLGLRLSGAVRFPGGEAAIPFQMIFFNPWFAIVLVVGVAWLLSRRARLGWLSLLGVLVLIPIPTALVLNNVESGLTLILMYALSGVVGAGIIAAGKPWRE